MGGRGLLFRVKICGITNWRDARLAIEGGADALGFNFYRPSPRYITPARARRIIARLPRGVAAVGVFVDEPLEKVKRIARQAGLDMVQLHGHEAPETVAAAARALPVIKAFRVGPNFRPGALRGYRRARALLLDGFSRRANRSGHRLPGGMGRTFDWGVARRARRYGRIILSGGLKPGNVARAIRQARPAAVDVCSGVEARPGKKDPARLRKLLREIEPLRSKLR